MAKSQGKPEIEVGSGVLHGLEGLSEREIAEALGLCMRDLHRLVRKPPERLTQSQSATLEALRERARVRRTDPPPAALDVGRPYAVLQELARLSDAGRRTPWPGLRKPLLGVVGPFDAGKSTMLNTWLGTGEHLRAHYAPTTSAVAHLKHLEDRPDFVSSTWAAVEGHRPDRPLTAVRATAATQKALGREDLADCDAVAFLDAPLLHAVDLIDTPGRGDQKRHDDQSRDIRSILDVIVWCSPYNHFLPDRDLQDLARLVTRAGALPRSPSSDPLGALYVVITQADVRRIDDGDLSQLREQAAQRLQRAIERNRPRGRGFESITKDHLLRRIFTFSAENGSRARILHHDLEQLLSVDFPQRRLRPVLDAVKARLMWPRRHRLLETNEP